ncbi:MAG: hypothetical protein JST94_05080 [Bacteroidetes bacterium]|nr:hypothetical protein [Bacteroidota bacterium]MBS1641143.1 hypothetical protein [Bacteroidota bacterium]MBS1670813.1 hypothetical protein [Bacteroidota bacterium]
MKNLLFVFILITAISCSSCKKSTPDPVSQLPPETQTGANTFGCLINGVAFTPKGSLFGPPSLQCAYQYLNGGYYFHLSASNYGANSENFSNVGVFTDSLKIDTIHNPFPLEIRYFTGKGYGQYGRYIISYSPNLYYTTSIIKGQLIIKRFDQINQIVSGTFWFNAINSNNDTIKITDGRFDMHYTL